MTRKPSPDLRAWQENQVQTLELLLVFVSSKEWKTCHQPPFILTNNMSYVEINYALFEWIQILVTIVEAKKLRLKFLNPKN